MPSSLSQTLRSTWQRASSGRQRTSSALREEILERGLTAKRARLLGAALEREGLLIDAVDALQTANRLRRDPALERHLVRLRRSAFSTIGCQPPADSTDPPVRSQSLAVRPDRAQDDVTRGSDATEIASESPGPPVVGRSQLDLTLLRDGIQQHGSVLVRGLVGAARVARLVAAIDRTFAAFDRGAAGAPVAQTTPWFEPFDLSHDGGILRAFARQRAAIWAADSPRTFYELLETLSDLGLDRLITAYLGERPALSAEKCSLRRAEPNQTGNAWHQDGAFIGHRVHSINAWFCLSHCGRDAPGLDIVPVRVPRVLQVGTPGAIYDWDVSAAVVRATFPNTPFWRPQLEPGDVMFFDHLCLHRTAVDAQMNKRRWAIETWFFAPSSYPATQTPLVV